MFATLITLQMIIDFGNKCVLRCDKPLFQNQLCVLSDALEITATSPSGNQSLHGIVFTVSVIAQDQRRHTDY